MKDPEPWTFVSFALGVSVPCSRVQQAMEMNDSCVFSLGIQVNERIL